MHVYFEARLYSRCRRECLFQWALNFPSIFNHFSTFKPAHSFLFFTFRWTVYSKGTLWKWSGVWYKPREPIFIGPLKLLFASRLQAFSMSPWFEWCHHWRLRGIFVVNFIRQNFPQNIKRCNVQGNCFYIRRGKYTVSSTLQSHLMSVYRYARAAGHAVVSLSKLWSNDNFT